MFYLFILESIGTSELILIGLIALIVLGPRKLPQMARTIGKTMAELRRSTNDFKATWEREVNFDEEKKSIGNLNILDDQNSDVLENSIAKNQNNKENALAMPEIKEINHEAFTDNFPAESLKTAEKKSIEETSAKQDWL